MIYTLTCNPALDCIVHVDNFQPGRLNRALSENLMPGGKGVNVSHMLKNLGHRSVSLGFSAGETGHLLAEMLKESGISSSFVNVREGMTRINIKVWPGPETEINAPGPRVAPGELDELLRKLDQLNTGDYLVLSGSIPPSLPDNLYRDILDRLNGRRIPVVVDVSGPALRNVCPGRPFLIKPNGQELGELFGIDLPDRDSVVPYAKKLQEEGARNVLVSLGANGAVLVSDNGRIMSCGAPSGKVRNTVGSGDSMVAGFLSGFIETGRLGDAFRMAVCSGSASAFSDGFASRAEVEDLISSLPK